MVYDGILYIYGGEDIKEGRFSDLWALNLEEFLKYEDHDMEDLEREEAERDHRFEWKLVKTHGDSPGALAHHKAVIHTQCMYVFGGIDQRGENNKHFYSLDMNSFKWTRKDAEGE